MPDPVYQLVLGKGWTEAWYQLSKDEQEALWAKVQEIDKRAGATWKILCDARWANEAYFDWGVLEYPSMEACQQKAAELEGLNWWRYFSADTVLGTEMADY